MSATEELQEEGRLPQSLRRSRSAIRRYATANRCNVLVSWTYSDRHLERAVSRDQVLLDGRNLVRFMRSRWGEPFPYVFMPEIQPERSEREGFEVYNGMLLVPRVPRAVFDGIRGGYRYGEGDGYNGIDITEWSDPRGGAQYASKALSRYASKSLGMAPPGRQAYRVGQGFQPRREEWGVSAPVWSSGDLLEVWMERNGYRVEALESVSDDDGRPLDVAWGMWAL